MSVSPHSVGKFSIGALAALVLVGGSFLMTSGDVAYNSQSLLAAVFSTFSSGPSITISRNPNSPSGSIIPGRSQVLAVFDVVPKYLTQPGTIETVPMQVSLSNRNAALSMRDFILTYQYCVPKGNIYAYGYKYGYAGTYCRSQTVAPSSVVLSGGLYGLIFTEPLPVFPDQISSTLTLNTTAFFTSNPTLQKPVSVRAQVKLGVGAKTKLCRAIRYGYQNRYGYLKCEPFSPVVNASLAYGNWLSVSRAYGYGTTSGAGAVVASTDASSPAYKLVAAGSSDVVIGAYRLHASGENVNVQKIGIKLTSGVSGDLVKVSLHDGATKVGEAYFIGASTSAITTLSQSVQVPKDNDKVITIKADFASIGTGQAVNHSGDLVQVDFLNGAGVGANSGGAISISGATATAGVRVMKTYPTVALHTGGLPVGGLADGRLMRFAVTADAHGPVGLTQLFVSVAPSGFSSGGISRLNVYGYSDSSYSNPIAGVSPSGAFLATDACPSGCASNTLVGIGVTTSAGTPTAIQIPAGQTRYFEVRGTVTGAQSGSSVTTRLAGDGAYSGMVSATSLVGKDAYFVWSPNSTTTALRSDKDWTTGFGIPGLPSSGLIFTRSNGGTPSPSVSFSATPLSGASPLTVTFTGDTGSGCNGGYFPLSYGDGQSEQIAIPADSCKGTFKKTHSYVGVGTFIATFSPKAGSSLLQTIVITADVPPPAQCADGIDNDGNGKADYPADSGCSSATDRTEASTPPPPAPIATLSVSPTGIVSGGSAILSWSSSNATSCTGSGFSTGNVTSGSASVSPSVSTNYSISCTGAGGSAQASRTLTVTSGAGGGGGGGNSQTDLQ